MNQNANEDARSRTDCELDYTPSMRQMPLDVTPSSAMELVTPANTQLRGVLKDGFHSRVNATGGEVDILDVPLPTVPAVPLPSPPSSPAIASFTDPGNGATVPAGQHWTTGPICRSSKYLK